MGRLLEMSPSSQEIYIFSNPGKDITHKFMLLFNFQSFFKNTMHCGGTFKTCIYGLIFTDYTQWEAVTVVPVYAPWRCLIHTPTTGLHAHPCPNDAGVWAWQLPMDVCMLSAVMIHPLVNRHRNNLTVWRGECY